MGFYITDKTIRLKIPSISYQIILNDIKNFINIPEKDEVSSFLNIIIKNFYLDSECTINENKDKIHQKYLSWLSGFEEADKIADILTEKEINEKKATILNKYPYPKRNTGHDIRYIMRLSIKEILENSLENTVYDRLSDYLSAMIQEYTGLPREKREIVFFGENFKKIKYCIEKNHEMEVKLYNQEVYIVRPCEIMTNGITPWNYVIGFAHEKQKVTEDKFASFRFQRIESIKERQKIKFTSSEKKKIQEVLQNPSQISYLIGNNEKIVVKLTLNGMKLYKNVILTNRPVHTDMKEDGEFTYLTFNCTTEQIYHYFIKLGKEAEIIEPLSLRERFAEMYMEAVKLYDN